MTARAGETFLPVAASVSLQFLCQCQVVLCKPFTRCVCCRPGQDRRANSHQRFSKIPRTLQRQEGVAKTAASQKSALPPRRTPQLLVKKGIYCLPHQIASKLYAQKLILFRLCIVAFRIHPLLIQVWLHCQTFAQRAQHTVKQGQAGAQDCV